MLEKWCGLAQEAPFHFLSPCRKRAAWEAQQQQEAEKRGEELAASRAQEIEEFDRQNHSAAPAPHTAAKRRAVSANNDDEDDFVTPSAPTGGNSNEEEGGDKGEGDGRGRGNFQGANSVKTTAFEEEAVRTMRAYWLPSQTPEAKMTVDPPPSDTLCPEGSEKLRLKDLFPVTFTEVPSDGKPAGRRISGATSAPVSGGKGRFMCPACTDTLTNASKLAAIVPCGHVLCVECVGKFVKRDKACMVCSVACGGARDVVELQHGGTGYAGHGDALVAKSFKHLGSGPSQTSGRKATQVG